MATDPGTLQRQKRFRDKRRQQGRRRVAVWLTPEAVAALEELKQRDHGDTEGDLVSQALTSAARARAPGAPLEATTVHARLAALLQAFRELKPDIQLHAVLAFATLGTQPDLDMEQLGREVGKSRLVTLWDLQDFQEPPLGRNVSMGLVRFDPPLGARGTTAMTLTDKGEAFVRRLGEIMQGILASPATEATRDAAVTDDKK
ncbi:MAG: hypothetical protein HQL82_12845 [Magnetococcales bacterium]|nr:hypothetical protein [Magnetococcales bacterium]